MKELNPLLHSQLRLTIMSILMNVEEADFVYLKEKTEATSGNISVQLDKLATAEYIEVKKSFVGKKPRTTCRITRQRQRCLRRVYKCSPKLSKTITIYSREISKPALRIASSTLFAVSSVNGSAPT